MVPSLKTRLIKALIEHFGEDDRRIQHALDVTGYAERILEAEGGDREIVLAVGLLHDVGIKKAEELHGYNNGKLQEQYGPPIVSDVLSKLGFDEEKIKESCAIVGAHHTPNGYSGPNFSALWDADMIVNLRDDSASDPEKLESIIEKSFKTETGKALARVTLFCESK